YGLFSNSEVNICITSLKDLHNKTILQGARIINSSKPIHQSSDVLAIQNQIAQNGKITFNIPDKEKRVISNNLDSIKQETDKYQNILEKESKSISTQLLALPAENRAKAFEKIFGSFMTETNFKGVSLIEPETRSAIAANISLRVLENLTNADIGKLLDEVTNFHNFIQFNEKITALSKNISDIFKLPNDDAYVFVLGRLKEVISTRFGSLDNFYNQHNKQVGNLTMANHPDAKLAFDNAQKDYSKAVEKLYQHYDAMINKAICQNSDDSTKILALDIKNLNTQEQKIQKELIAINAKIKVLHSGGHYYNLSKIKETSAELSQLKVSKESEFLSLNTQKEQKIQELVKVNHTKDLRFDTPDIQALKKTIQDSLDAIRLLSEAEQGLGDKNIKEFKDLKVLLTVVNTKTPVENQAVTINKEVKKLKATNVHQTNTDRFLSLFMSRTIKPSVTLFDTVKQQIKHANGDDRLIKEAIRSLYTSLDAHHKHKFEVEIGKATGVQVGYFSDKASAQAGQKYLETYFKELPSKALIDKTLIQRVIDSEACKTAITAPTSSTSYLKASLVGLSILGAATYYATPSATLEYLDSGINAISQLLS
ncbi:MAG: hypothetical protein WCG10_03205, partial [Chlamydiota bacterium]